MTNSLPHRTSLALCVRCANTAIFHSKLQCFVSELFAILFSFKFPHASWSVHTEYDNRLCFHVCLVVLVWLVCLVSWIHSQVAIRFSYNGKYGRDIFCITMPFTQEEYDQGRWEPKCCYKDCTLYHGACLFVQVRAGSFLELGAARRCSTTNVAAYSVLGYKTPTTQFNVEL